MGRVSIPVESEPRIEVPFFVITVPHEGISPEDATRLLILPLEIELKSVEGIKEITGAGAEHKAIVAVEFTTETDLDVALSDVREEASAPCATHAQPGIIASSFSTPRSLALLTLPQPSVQAHFRIGKDLQSASRWVTQAYWRFTC